MSEQENKELIRRGYEAFAAGDMESLMSLFDDDIEWVQPGESAVSGTYHGKTELMEYLGRLAQRPISIRVDQMTAEGDTVVALTEISVDGQIGRDADVFTVRDGKTIAVRIHGDTALMERVYGKKELAAG
ncbi:nuclear transport factor 2 family protein [Mycolicibacterium novocastrense]|uniref:Ketosteroid isomerase-like protein n=1 Tax=Mycolicibacterium novocastrense TaxID=59813 RepID=A0AAW5SR44_MYCNV|nr:nuclear transport factor 2 family protein [Mycolicibacterium novocastrense]MCV7026575.1 nuclear transport factor 2 family protein [Mycolicibacterium novocastrense]GAT09450.1 ketosteroid isomerase-like protein [Mycolicibacterium novocastrense]